MAGGLDGPEGEDELVEWHRSGRPGGELGERGEGEPPRSRRGEPKVHGEYAVPVGEGPTGKVEEGRG